MSTIQEAMLRNGVFLYNLGGEPLTIEGGAGSYMVCRDRSGRVKYRIENSLCSNRLAVIDPSTNSLVTYLDAA
ncbi:MAG: hypothetical protein Q4E47_02625 [Candidatus Saccharibacteria bacterium]|nr:hypothetical protein [Candidatus Saccharibacteria bacterium]